MGWGLGEGELRGSGLTIARVQLHPSHNLMFLVALAAITAIR